MYCCAMKNIYATIKLQALPNLFTPASTRKKIVPYSIFETRLLELLLVSQFNTFIAISQNLRHFNVTLRDA
jgi:hypothetical protein